MSEVFIEFVDANHIHIDSEPAVLKEISDHFSFEMPGAKFSPAAKRGWDGRVRLLKNGFMGRGLRQRLENYCAQEGHSVQIQGQGRPSPEKSPNITLDEVKGFVASLGLPESRQPRDYQIQAFHSAVTKGRGLFISPTSSGKSLIIYMLCRFWTWQSRKLIIVPRTGLIGQMQQDFVDYGANPATIATKILPQQPEVTIMTWQTVVRQSKEWLAQFDIVIGDEAHGFKAKSLVEIMDNMPGCHHRFGFTGTLDGSKVNELVLEGIFGPPEKVISTAKLMARGQVSQASIDVIVLKHPGERSKGHCMAVRKAIRDAKLEEKPAGAVGFAIELDYLATCPARNRFLINLALALKGNTMITFHRLEQGQALLNEVRGRNTNRPVYFVDGGVDGDERNEIRALIEKHDNAIFIASVGTSSTGTNIQQLNNLIMGAPFRSRIINLQSIGRVLRLAEGKSTCKVYDIADDLSHKDWQNYTLKHVFDRVKIYASELFDYRMINLDLDY